MLWSRPETSGDSAIFIDRDGVVNRRRANDYVLDWTQFVFVDGIREALRELSSLGLPIILISNQSAVGRGLLQPEQLMEITERMRNRLEQDGARLDAAYFCPHRPDEACACRKPQPGLLKQAAADFAVDLSRSVFIGDSDSDVKAAHAVECNPVLFGPGLTAWSDSQEWMDDLPVAGTAGELFAVTLGVWHKANPEAVLLPQVASPRRS
jgi:D-glycero-D-manno-heptose 1,7-bisphosphate phosphatase